MRECSANIEQTKNRRLGFKRAKQKNSSSKAKALGHDTLTWVYIKKLNQYYTPVQAHLFHYSNDLFH